MAKSSSPTDAIFVVVALLFLLPCALAEYCKNQHAHLRVTSGRNSTGHWLLSLHLEQQNAKGTVPDVTVVDFTPSTSTCDGIRTDTLHVSMIGPSNPLVPGYKALPGLGYYKIHEEVKSWEDAKIVCEQEGAHLLILNSEEEASAIQPLIKDYPDIYKSGKAIHIGFNDKVKEGSYITIFGQSLSETGFSRWHVGQPDNFGGNEHCGSIEATTMGLNDLPCTTWKTYFICERSNL